MSTEQQIDAQQEAQQAEVLSPGEQRLKDKLAAEQAAEASAPNTGEDFKKKVEEEKAALATKEPETIKLQEVIEGLKWDDKGFPIPVDAKILIIAYSPNQRNVVFRHVRGVQGVTDIFAILRDSLLQLEQMELVRKVMANVTISLRNEMAGLYAALKGRR